MSVTRLLLVRVLTVVLTMSMWSWAQHHEHLTSNGEQSPPLATLSVHTERSTFQFAYLTQGSAWMIMPTAQLSLTEQFSVFLATPVGIVNERKKAANWGLADAMLGVTARWRQFDATLQVMVPTGDSHLGLGAEHLMLQPQAGFSLLSPFGLFRFALAGQGAIGTSTHAHQSLVMPMDVLDLRARAGFRTNFSERFYLSLSSEGVWAAIPNPIAPVGTRLNGRVGAGVRLGAVEVSLGAMAAVLGRSGQPNMVEAAVSTTFDR